MVIPPDMPPAEYHSLTVDEVQSFLETSPRGLSADEASIRLARQGRNEIEGAPRTGSVVLFIRQFTSPLIYILLAAAILTAVLGKLVDTAVIAAVLLLNAAIGYFQERRAEEAVRELMQLVSPRARVMRDGHERELESVELVTGDVVWVESGTRVPADLRLFSTSSLMIDESLLTGESAPATKDLDTLPRNTEVSLRSNMAHMGTTVTSGRGRGYVVATGRRTQLGQIADEIRHEERVATPMQIRMERFARLVAAAVVSSAVLAFAIGIAAGESRSDMLLAAAALAVAAIPEGLPVASTVTLAIGVRRMARRNAVIRRLAAAETLGSTTVIGSDKTGTLTENRMTVTDAWTGAGRHAIGSAPVMPVGYEGAERLESLSPLYLTLLCGVLTNEAEFYEEAGHVTFTGDPTEGALLYAAQTEGIDTEAARESFRVVAHVPFEPERQYSATFREYRGTVHGFVKGAPEKVLSMSSSLAGPTGAQPLDADLVRAAASELARDGLRVLGLAILHAIPGKSHSTHVPELTNLTFLGLEGMMDPPRPGVEDAIQACNRSGMRVLMITGDHPDTASAIGREIGIAHQDDSVVTGRELDAMDDQALSESVATTSIYARISPQGKLRIVRALQRSGEVVAVTGDGVNDAPALKSADIGVAMGRSGTDVAREAADMVLTDDNFVSIQAAVEEGRVTFDNLRKVTFFLVGTGAAAVMAILAALALGWPLPLLPVQIVWLNLVTNGVQDIALAFEPKEKGILDRPPRRRDEGIISRVLWERIALTGVVMAVGTLTLFRWTLDDTGSIDEARTVMLTTMVLFQALHIGNCRSENLSVFQKNPFSNPILFLTAAIALTVHISALYIPLTQKVLKVEPLDATEWTVMVAMAGTVIVVNEVHKLLRRRFPVKEPSPVRRDGAGEGG